ncbi:hypothetical protein PCO31111_04884 [Pandoraea communis]|uniref:Uncharacterized protein n=1 Tax=Pandoraea communis TaxID=2508297 RepID=A0A5E4YY43_9BURK|nr:hypothetical protein [Pandoraea communis]VVE53368.1 hypothetical protein PCO31111_04884 [Pandoraea communis]
MPDLKTVTFDASQWQPIETAPKTGCALLLGYENSHGKWRTIRGKWISKETINEEWDEPEDFDAGWYEVSVEADDAPNCWPTTPTHWMPLPSAPGTAPTPAAQSAATLSDWQWIELANRHVASDWGCDKPDGFLNAVKALCVDFAAQSAGQEAVAWRFRGSLGWNISENLSYVKSVAIDDEIEPLYAAPVNASEPVAYMNPDEHDASEAFIWNKVDHLPSYSVPVYRQAAPVNGGERECKCDTRTKLAGDGCDVCNPQRADDLNERAADAQQVAGESDDLFNHWYETKFRPAMERGPFDKYVARQAWFAALTSPAKVGGNGLIEQHARDSAELRRLCAARDEARRTAEYWKANHLAGNAEIERLRKLLEVKVGRDEREAFEAEATILSYRIAKDEDGDYLALDTAIAFRLFKALKARAALSADGGERKDAERWRWLVSNGRTGSIGFGDWWINADEPKSEWDAAIDAAIAAKAKGEA